MNSTPAPRTRKDILADMHEIPVIIEGKLGERRGSQGQVTGHKLQRWRNGKNQTIYVPDAQVESVQQGTAGFRRFTELAQEYVAFCEQEALRPADPAKKKPTRR